MAQRLKSDVRQRIVSAAAAEFLAKGFEGAHLSAIAARAGLSTGNLYRYFSGKDALFLAAVPRDIAAALLRLTRSRVRELEALPDWRGATGEGSAEAARLLQFWIDNRVAVSILLARADKSPLEQVRPLLERHFNAIARRRFAQTHATPASEARTFVMRRIFEGTLDIVAAILSRFDDDADIRRAIDAFWTYQLAGLEALASASPPDATMPGRR